MFMQGYLSVCTHRCGLAGQVSDVKQLCLTLGDVSVPLPSEVKAIGSATDSVLPLEELACRVLHAAHSWAGKCKSRKQTYDNCIGFLHIYQPNVLTTKTCLVQTVSPNLIFVHIRLESNPV